LIFWGLPPAAASLRELYPNEEFVINLLGAEKERLKVVDTMAVVIKSKVFINTYWLRELPIICLHTNAPSAQV
jgi:hypothetical protein